MKRSNMVCYQIYPKSFRDSNGDGAGDLPGVIEKLDYLAGLGVNALWLCPAFPSPMVDNGYDVADYRGVNPLFGTMADMDRLIAEGKKRGIGIILDLVLNHSSDKHEWFQKAIGALKNGDEKNKYAGYYIFKKSETRPNNWRSIFGGSVWEKVEGAADYWYMHTFAAGQPDLNWENPALRYELFDMINWWLDKGVIGFRIDAISYIKKDQAYPSLPPDAPDGLAGPGTHWCIAPGIEPFLAEMRDKGFAPKKAFTVAEAYGIEPERIGEFIGGNGYFSTSFDFSYTDLEMGIWHRRPKLSTAALRERMFANEEAVKKAGGRGAPYFENHDQNRSPNRYLPAARRNADGKKMLAVCFMFLRGTPFVYQGQELGMENHPWKTMDDFDDVSTPDQYRRAIEAGFSEKEAFDIVAYRSRDNARTPMLWSGGPNAGFTTGEPWLPVHPDYKTVNAETEAADSNSVLNFYRRAIALRKTYADLFYDGDLIPRYLENENIIAYERRAEKDGVLVLCGFSDKDETVTLPRGAEVLLANMRGEGETLAAGANVTLKPNEALVLKLR